MATKSYLCLTPVYFEILRSEASSAAAPLTAEVLGRWELELIIIIIIIIISLLYMRTFTLDQQRKNKKTVNKLYEIQPTGPARRLATQQVGYD